MIALISTNHYSPSIPVIIVESLAVTIVFSCVTMENCIYLEIFSTMEKLSVIILKM